jgi:hypothetical protein
MLKVMKSNTVRIILAALVVLALILIVTRRRSKEGWTLEECEATHIKWCTGNDVDGTPHVPKEKQSACIRGASDYCNRNPFVKPPNSPGGGSTLSLTQFKVSDWKPANHDQSNIRGTDRYCPDGRYAAGHHCCPIGTVRVKNHCEDPATGIKFHGSGSHAGGGLGYGKYSGKKQADADYNCFLTRGIGFTYDNDKQECTRPKDKPKGSWQLKPDAAAGILLGDLSKDCKKKGYDLYNRNDKNCGCASKRIYDSTAETCHNDCPAGSAYISAVRKCVDKIVSDPVVPVTCDNKCTQLSDCPTNYICAGIPYEGSGKEGCCRHST